VADDEPRAEVYAAATKKDQAMILFRDAVAMVDQSPELHSRLVKSGGQEHCWNLGYVAAGSFFRAISSDDGQSGPRPHCSLIDEIHEHKDATVVNMMKAGQKGRRQPLQVEITNSGFDRTTICYEHHEYSERIVNALEQNDTWFAYVCALDKGEDPMKSEACWPKANPNLGVSIPLQYLRDEVREARGMPSKASKVKRLNFCCWVDAENPWIDSALWYACEGDFDAIEELAECGEVVGALDLSGTTDLTALGLTGTRGDDEIVARVEYWTPKDTLEERTKVDKVPYALWVEQEHMAATPGRAVDYAFVAQRLADLQARLPMFKRCAFDPYRIKYLQMELDRINCQIELIEHPQGFYKAQPKKDAKGNDLPALWMPRSIELTEAAIGQASPKADEQEPRSFTVGGGTPFEALAGALGPMTSAEPPEPKKQARRLRVQRNPVLTWNSASAVLEADPKNNRIFTKRKSRGRIDGLVALAMSIGLLLDETPAAAPRKFQMLVFG
jgi:phage terminase large subunit-like protein